MESDHDRIIRLEEQLQCAVQQYEQYAKLTESRQETSAAHMNERLERMNEFRGALADAQATFITRDFYDRQHSDVEHRIDMNNEAIIAVRLRQSSAEATAAGQRTGSDRLLALIFSLITASAIIISVIIATR